MQVTQSVTQWTYAIEYSSTNKVHSKARAPINMAGKDLCMHKQLPYTKSQVHGLQSNLQDLYDR